MMSKVQVVLVVAVLLQMLLMAQLASQVPAKRATGSRHKPEAFPMVLLLPLPGPHNGL